MLYRLYLGLIDPNRELWAIPDCPLALEYGPFQGVSWSVCDCSKWKSIKHIVSIS